MEITPLEDELMEIDSGDRNNGQVEEMEVDMEIEMETRLSEDDRMEIETNGEEVKDIDGLVCTFPEDELIEIARFEKMEICTFPEDELMEIDSGDRNNGQVEEMEVDIEIEIETRPSEDDRMEIETNGEEVKDIDGLVTSTSLKVQLKQLKQLKQLLKQFLQELKAKFKVKVNEPRYFVGLEIERDRDKRTVEIHQVSYIEISGQVQAEINEF